MSAEDRRGAEPVAGRPHGRLGAEFVWGGDRGGDCVRPGRVRLLDPLHSRLCHRDDGTGHERVAALNDRGHAAVELGLAVGVLLLPAALAVLAFGPWSERRVFAEAAASEAVRAAVIQLDMSAGNQVVRDMAANHGLGPDLVRLSWCGAAGSGPETCTFARGSVVTAEVEVWVPLVATPWGEVGGLWVGASHSELVDLYRSLP